MNGVHYKFTDKELKTLIDSLVIIVDTREQKNQHILEYFRKKEVQVKFMGMKAGDYSAMIPANEELGLTRDIYLRGVIERKNGVDELVGTIKERTRFENELIRASQHPFTLIVEDLNGYEKILNGQYISQYKPQSLLGSIKTFEARYNFSTVFVSPNTSGNYILHHFLYMAREVLKS